MPLPESRRNYFPDSRGTGYLRRTNRDCGVCQRESHGHCGETQRVGICRDIWRGNHPDPRVLFCVRIKQLYICSITIIWSVFKETNTDICRPVMSTRDYDYVTLPAIGCPLPSSSSISLLLTSSSLLRLPLS